PHGQAHLRGDAAGWALSESAGGAEGVSLRRRRQDLRQIYVGQDGECDRADRSRFEERAGGSHSRSLDAQSAGAEEAEDEKQSLESQKALAQFHPQCAAMNVSMS